MQKFIVNFLFLGIWYFWDVLQIIYEGDKVKKDGLCSPLDWIRGIGRGVFVDPAQAAAEAKAAAAAEDGHPSDAKVVQTQKDIVIYAMLTVMFGIFGLDKFYIGRPWQGLGKLLSVFNIFLFLFGIGWAIYDAVNVLFFTDTLVKKGITVPMPYSFLFETTPAKELFVPQMVSLKEVPQEPESLFQTLFSPLHAVLQTVGLEHAAPVPATGSGSTLPLPSLDTFRFLYKELAVPLLRPSVGTTINKVAEGVKVTEQAVDVGKEVISTVPKVASAVTGELAAVANPNVMIEKIQAAAAAKAAERVSAVPGVAAATGVAAALAHKGGGGQEIGSGPIIAGTLTAVMLAGAVKVVAELLSTR
jgi:TM2 domain-containing membrane protein YozV